MLIGILQTGEAPDVLSAEMGDYPDMFQRLLDGQGFEFRTFRVVDMEFPASVRDCDGWLITGSRHGVYEDHPFIRPLEEFIRKAYAEHVPVVGICFGHQIVAQAMGGKVERFDKGWAVGPTSYDFNGEPITLNAWHRDQVTAAPETAEVVASNEFCENAALLYDTRAFTVQAHPEFRDEFIDGLMRTRGKGLVPDDRMEAAQEKLGQPNDAARMAHRIAEFFKQAR
ncbi:type 1 glutamine amidotransferase [Cereibacter sphaeroides]|uniref:type 1 glutamine amidotransferase n=1 Tax=Cereibacter sphaeroides TaxID=1063 RepID=UPI001F2C3017|nr:type 1 glutamine amidotransferase [Cereibacter sphaeroides]MCE6960530.1 type 1 glutamine amidotransferase [Cereibacter sphaeroides]MCE6969480.1 type 1 glutamine amidotransferase [Cereibacter sphaeroides]MCE6975538.1 type 1 glutamine amidotransferase [Cereibacter sphaeroides]